MHVLVTGSSGFIGSFLLQKLGEKGKAFHASSRVPSHAECVSQMQDVQCVVHLAGGGGNKLCASQPKKAVEDNILLTEALVRAAIEAGVPQFIFSSTIGVYTTFAERDNPLREAMDPQPDDLYGSLKYSCEELVKKASYTILRFANVYGYGTGTNLRKGGFVNAICAHAREKGEITVTDGRLEMDLVSVSDVVEAILLAIGNKSALSQTINIGTGKGQSLESVANRVVALSENDVQLRVEYNKQYATRYLDITKAQEILGWNPRVAIDDEIGRLLSHDTKR